MKKIRVLIKLGGASLADASVLDTFAVALKKFSFDARFQLIVVHGGGPAINAELTRRGIAWNFLNGQRVTTPEMMEVVEKVLAQDVNAQLTGSLNSAGFHAVGISGTASQLLFCKAASEDLGRVGAISRVHPKAVEEVFARDENAIPVIAPIGIGFGGETYNINADWAASHLAVALGCDTLIFLTDQNGILNADKKPALQVSTDEIEDMIARDIVTGGMLTKSRSILYALENGVKLVRVLNAQDADKAKTHPNIGSWCFKVQAAPVLQEVLDVSA